MRLHFLRKKENMASFAKSKENYIEETSCCKVPCVLSKCGTFLICGQCGEEVIVVPVGQTIEQALLDHARKNTEAAKRTTVSPLRHNAIQIMQHFGESTFLLANDQWELWNVKNKTKEDIEHIDKLVMGIINVYVMNRCIAGDADDIMVQDIAEALYNDKEYLERMSRKAILEISAKIGCGILELQQEMLEICVHEPLKEVLSGFCSTEVYQAKT
jgi:hypothetical protein